jgi:hypothetical protein
MWDRQQRSRRQLMDTSGLEQPLAWFDSTVFVLSNGSHRQDSNFPIPEFFLCLAQAMEAFGSVRAIASHGGRISSSQTFQA